MAECHVPCGVVIKQPCTLVTDLLEICLCGRISCVIKNKNTLSFTYMQTYNLIVIRHFYVQNLHVCNVVMKEIMGLVSCFLSGTRTESQG